MILKISILTFIFIAAIFGGMASNAFANGRGFAWLVILVSFVTVLLWLALVRQKQLLSLSALYDLVFCGGYFVGLIIVGQKATPMQWIGIVLAVIAIFLLA
jgi:drug/metabolite transporter (DMT)-like permease